MSESHSLQTTNCFVCGKKAKSHTGHVHLKDEDKTAIITGLCKKHKDEDEDMQPIKGCSFNSGCNGYWKSHMGIEVVIGP